MLKIYIELNWKNRFIILFKSFIDILILFVKKSNQSL